MLHTYLPFCIHSTNTLRCFKDFCADLLTTFILYLICRCKNGDWAQRTDWHQVAVFNPIVRENVKNYLTKGQRVLLFGKITYGEVKDKDGNSRTLTSIVAEDVTFFQ